MISYLKKNYSWFIIIFFGIIYFIFLSNNQTSDAYSNAYSSLTGEELFRPHHLLYSVLGYLVYLPLKFTSIEPIKIFQCINVLFAMSCLIVIRIMMLRIHSKESLISLSIIFLGSCFGFQRFAIDNECYIIPLFLTLIAMNFVQSFLIKNKFYKVILCALACVLGCLFHQIVIFALISSFLVVLFNKRLKYILSFIGISLILPITYALVVFIEKGSFSISLLMNFVLHDYTTSNAELPILNNVIILSAISFIRTFIQVHGYMFKIVSSYPLISIIVITISLAFLVYGIIYAFKLKKRNLALFQERRFVRYSWGMLILYFGFAVFSNGNAEFMIIIPFLLILLSVYYLIHIRKVLFGFGLFMFVWNLYFTLIPMGYMKLNSNKDIVDLIIKEPTSIYVLKDKVAVENIYMYKENGKDIPNIYKISDVKEDKFNNWVKEKKTIYTDCFGGKEVASRATIAETYTNNISSSNPIIKNKKSFKSKYKFTSNGSEKEIWTFISNFAN